MPLACSLVNALMMERIIANMRLPGIRIGTAESENGIQTEKESSVAEAKGRKYIIRYAENQSI